LDAFRASFGERHPSIATCLASLARLKMAEGELAAAERLVREALQMVRETAGDEQPVFAHNSTTLAEILIATGRFEAAEETARAAERLYDTLLPVEHWRRAVARSVLAASLVGQGRFADAEPMLLASLDALRRTRGDGDPLTRDVLSRLVTLYETWGRRERLAEYRTLLARAES
jgi:ATP/maltotriose-dependent transcriptional regulator MalT